MGAKGGNSLRSGSFYTLIVGCNQAHVNFTHSVSTPNVMYVSNSTADALTWAAPTVVPSYCAVVSYALID